MNRKKNIVRHYKNSKKYLPVDTVFKLFDYVRIPPSEENVNQFNTWRHLGIHLFSFLRVCLRFVRFFIRTFLPFGRVLFFGLFRFFADFVVQHLVLGLLVKQHVLSAAESELDHVLLDELHVALRVDLLVVDESSVGRLEVDDVRPHPSTDGAVVALVVHEPVLEHGVLFGAGGMVDGNVRAATLAPEEVGALAVDRDEGQTFLALERVQAPPTLGLSSLPGLVVLYDDAVVDVGVFGQRSRQPEVRLFLGLGGRGGGGVVRRRRRGFRLDGDVLGFDPAVRIATRTIVVSVGPFAPSMIAIVSTLPVRSLVVPFGRRQFCPPLAVTSVPASTSFFGMSAFVFRHDSNQTRKLSLVNY